MRNRLIDDEPSHSPSCARVQPATVGSRCDCDKAEEDEAFRADADREMFGDEDPYDPVTGWK